MNIQRSDILRLNEAYDVSSLVDKYGSLYSNINWDNQRLNLQAYRNFLSDFMRLDRQAQIDFVQQMIDTNRAALKNLYDLGIWLKGKGFDEAVEFISAMKALTK